MEVRLRSNLHFPPTVALQRCKCSFTVDTLKSMLEMRRGKVLATPSKGNLGGKASIQSLLGIVRRSSDLSLWLACCWRRERLASRDGNEEKDEHVLLRTTWVVSFDGDAHCLIIHKIEVFRQRVNAETCRDMIHGRGCENGRWGRTAKGWLWRFLAETGTSLAESDGTS